MSIDYAELRLGKAFLEVRLLEQGPLSTTTLRTEELIWLYDRIEQQEREIAELRQGEELSEALTDGLSKLLDGAIVALRGPHPPNGLWGVADVPDRIRALQAELAAAKGGER